MSKFVQNLNFLEKHAPHLVSKHTQGHETILKYRHSESQRRSSSTHRTRGLNFNPGSIYLKKKSEERFRMPAKQAQLKHISSKQTDEAVELAPHLKKKISKVRFADRNSNLITASNQPVDEGPLLNQYQSYQPPQIRIHEDFDYQYYNTYNKILQETTPTNDMMTEKM